MSSSHTHLIGLKVKSKRMPTWLTKHISVFFNRLFGFAQFNELYANLPPHEDHELSKTILSELNIKLRVSGEPLSSYPNTGPQIYVVNHPHGLVDGFAIDQLVASLRPDTQIMSMYVLGNLPEFKKLLILVDPLHTRKNRAMNIKGWRQAFRLVSGSGAFVVFPAGAVSHFHWNLKEITDPQWNPHIASLARRTNATVIPVYIHRRNSVFFQLAGAISQNLHNLMLFRELPKMKNKTLHITFGKSMPAETWSHIKEDIDLIQHFRKSVEALGKNGD